MPHNSHNPSISETQKPFKPRVTAEIYDFAVLTKAEFCSKYEVTQKYYEYRLKEINNA
jgi:hypothetical protein